MRRAHLQWVVEFCRRASEDFEGPDPLPRVEQCRHLLADLRTALDFAEGILQTLVDIGPRLLADAEPNYDDRATLVWAATLALNGLIGAGVPQDWSTHMVGHELTALHGIDHARTLAIVLPSMLDQRREQKQAKLLQYGERVWGITSGTPDERVDAAIARTRAFFEAMGIPTRLGAYGLGAEAIEAVLQQLEDHGMTRLGEQREVTLEVSRRVLEGAL